MPKISVDSVNPEKHAHSKTAKPNKKKERNRARVSTDPASKAHHAKLVPSACKPDCTVRTLLDLVSKSLRTAHSQGFEEEKYGLADDEEFAITLDPIKPNIFALRRENSISNRFDDLMVVLYQPPHLKEDGKTLEDDDLVKANLEDVQKFVDEVLATEHPAERAAPEGWPAPGKDVSCGVCKHWRALAFPMSTDPGYEKDKHYTEHGFDDESKLAAGEGSIVPGTFDSAYRLGLHLASRTPPNSYPALQVAGTMPGRRRYPVRHDYQKAEAAFDRAGEHRRRHPGNAPPDANELQAHRDRILKSKRQAARAHLQAAVSALREAAGAKDATTGHYERILRVEGPDGSTRQALAEGGKFVTAIEVAELDPGLAPVSPLDPDDTALDQLKMEKCIGVRLVLKPKDVETQPDQSPKSTAQSGVPSPQSDDAIVIRRDEVLVMPGTVNGTNIHMSQHSEEGAFSKGREVENWSEGCQVFRSPKDFHVLLRLAQLYKRACCEQRGVQCREAVDGKLISSQMSESIRTFLEKRPSDHWKDEDRSLTANEIDLLWVAPAGADVEVPLVGRDDVRARLLSALEGVAWRQFGEQEYARELATRALDVAEKRYWATAALATDVVVGQDEFQDVESAYLACLQQGIAAWVTKKAMQFVGKIAERYQVDKFEACDFGTCGIRLDYTLVEVTEAELRDIVDRLSARPWNTISPESAGLPIMSGTANRPGLA